MTALSRRQLVQGVGAVGLALVAGCGRLPWHGRQPPPKVPTVGYISASAPVEGLRQGLAARGYVEGQNVVLEYRFTDGSEAQTREAAADLVRREVAVIVAAGGGLPVRAAQSATTAIPIVFTSAGDPVGEGLVASLARPGGNVTGLSTFSPQLSSKRLELLTQAVPGLRRVAYLWGPGATPPDMRQIQAAAEALGLQLQVLEIRDSADLEAAFDAASAEQADAVMMTGARLEQDPARVVSLAASRRLPAMYPGSRTVHQGGLMSYGANLRDLQRRAATYVDKILKGENPADLPIEQPREFDFVINLQTARALGLTIPPHVLAQATEVIQ
jgi:putative tryptophan/tyrosine transport system substrate-binding protein